MTDIEALLSVDAGRTPANTVAFFIDDTDQSGRLVALVMASLSALAAVGCGLAHAGLQTVTLLTLGAALMALRATPTVSEESVVAPTRRVMVVTTGGLIVRDAWGLRSWRFEDLAGVVAGIYDSRPHLQLIDQKGKRHTVECPQFRTGERARKMISARLNVGHQQSLG
jgi:hypothetical protein